MFLWCCFFLLTLSIDINALRHPYEWFDMSPHSHVNAFNYGK